MIKRQTGVVLPIALIILVLVTVIAVAGVNTGTFELQMSTNEELSTQSFQTSQSAADQVAETKEHFIVVGYPGVTVKCTSNITSGCLDSSLTLGGTTFNADTTVKISRLYPESGNPRRDRTRAMSGKMFSAVYFQIESQNRLADRHLGYAKVIQGVSRTILKQQSGEE